MILRIRMKLAEWRLVSHMYDRVIGGGTPDCPCERCERDAAFLARHGEPWQHPDRARWWAAHEKAIESLVRETEDNTRL